MEQAKKSVEILETELAVLKDVLNSVQNSPAPDVVKQEFPQTPNTLPRSDLQEQYDKLVLSHAKLVKLRKGDIKSVNLWKEALQEHKGKLKEVNARCRELQEENTRLRADLEQLRTKQIKNETSPINVYTSHTCPESDEISTDQIRAEAQTTPSVITRQQLESSPPSGAKKKGVLIKDSIDLDAFPCDESSPSVAREIDSDLENDTRRHEGVIFKQPKPTGLMQWLKVKDDAQPSRSKKREGEIIEIGSQGSPKEKPKKMPRKGKHVAYDLNDFVVNPEYNGNLDYAYSETVRGADRHCEHGTECDQCDKFYKMAGPGLVSAAPQWSTNEEYPSMNDKRGRKLRLDETINASSRHRNRWKRAPSPPGFWRSDFPSTQEIEEEKRIAEENRRKEVESRYKSAVSGGKWMFRSSTKNNKTG